MQSLYDLQFLLRLYMEAHAKHFSECVELDEIMLVRSWPLKKYGVHCISRSLLPDISKTNDILSQCLTANVSLTICFFHFFGHVLIYDVGLHGLPYYPILSSVRDKHTSTTPVRIFLFPH